MYGPGVEKYLMKLKNISIKKIKYFLAIIGKPKNQIKDLFDKIMKIR